jgi:hypothetical protein
MVNLIILGIIPGTKSQLSFYGLLLASFILLSIVLVATSSYTYFMNKKRAFVREDFNKPGLYNLISI